MNTSGCVFCKIVEGTIPSTRIYEDDAHLAFLDIGPINPGHVLVIPKEHVDPVTAMTPHAFAAMSGVVLRIARAVVDGTGADGLNIHQSNGACAGQVVPHVHVHLIPRWDDDGHSFHWRQGRYESDEQMQAEAARIRAALG